MSIENHVSLTGNLGNDVDLRYNQGGTAVAKISLATTSKRKDRDGNPQERTEWHRVVFFGKLAEVVGEYLGKGDKIQVVGSLRYGKYEKDGVTHYTTDIIADHMLMLGSKREGGERPARQEYAPRRGRDDETINRQRQAQQETSPLDDFADDEIPF